MRQLRQLVAVALVFALTGLSWTVQAQVTRRVNQREVRQLLARIENRSDVFKQSMSDVLNNSRIDGTTREDNINQFISDFENATDRLRVNFNSRRETRSDVEDVLNYAARINAFMMRTRVVGLPVRNWDNLRVDLSTLARLYNINWNWSNQNNPPSVGIGVGPGRYNRLTGTYRLDTSRSEDPRTAAERATRGLPSRDRQRALDALTTRLEAPDTIAIDRQGRNVTIASSRAPQISFEADGVERVERLDNGRTVRVRATLVGDQLNISQTGDRGNDYSVSFDQIDNGRRLRITRRISSDRLTQPVVVESLYDKTSETAQLNVYNGYPNYPNSGGSVSGDFIIPNGVQLIAVLNDNLSTREARDNDRFTMTVRSPSQYDGATIEGYVSNVSRSGRVTGRSEMTFNFETIRLRNGRTHSFAGFVDSVRTPGGETVRVNNEGNVQENDSRTSTTVKRAAIGTAIGAIIGAIAGGGKGAAIGAAVGAGAGAGSVYVQGRDDLELTSGSEVTITASAPR